MSATAAEIANSLMENAYGTTNVTLTSGMYDICQNLNANLWPFVRQLVAAFVHLAALPAQAARTRRSTPRAPGHRQTAGRPLPSHAPPATKRGERSTA
jgi:hypothetical protein